MPWGREHGWRPSVTASPPCLYTPVLQLRAGTPSLCTEAARKHKQKASCLTRHSAVPTLREHSHLGDEHRDLKKSLSKTQDSGMISCVPTEIKTRSGLSSLQTSWVPSGRVSTLASPLHSSQAPRPPPDTRWGSKHTASRPLLPALSPLSEQ